MMKRKKKLLWILIPIGVVVIAAGVALAFWLTREEEPQAYLLDISSYDNITNSVLQVNSPWEGEGQDAPLSRYPSAAPEGYEQLLDAADYANRYSTSYTDVYRKDSQVVYVEQSYAWNRHEVHLLTYAHFETVQFGGREVFCYTEEEYSGAVWLDGDHLMEVLVYGTMERDDLLAWVAGVDSQNPVEPAVRPLEFVPGYRVQVGASMRTAPHDGKWSTPPSAATPPPPTIPPSAPSPRRRKGLPFKRRFRIAGKASISAGSTGMPTATRWSWKTGPFRITTLFTPSASGGATRTRTTGKIPAR